MRAYPPLIFARGPVMDYLYETHLAWVISLGCDIMARLLSTLLICKNYHINAKYM